MRKRLSLMSLALGILVGSAQAGVTVYAGNGSFGSFMAATGSPAATLDFDSIAAGTDIGGSTVYGAEFASLGGSTLSVVKASETFSTPGGFPGFDDLSGFVLPSTSGENVLSPGGAELVPGPDPRESDSLGIRFVGPTTYFSFDHLSQSRDGASYTSISVFGTGDVLLYSGGVPIGVNDPWSGGADFWGIVSDSQDIVRVELWESDGNNGNPDSNIGLDTLRYEAVPEPGTMLSLGIGALALRRRSGARR